MSELMAFTTSRYDPASRFRLIQFIPYLIDAGWFVDHRPNRPDRQWRSRIPNRILRGFHYRFGRQVAQINRWFDIQAANKYDAIFINRNLAGSGIFLEQMLLRHNQRVVFDFDDAIYMGNERNVQWMCENSAWVTPGNDYLAAFASQYTKAVTIIPTVIDTDEYSIVSESTNIQPNKLRIGWSGSDLSIRHTLFKFLPTLANIQKLVDFELIIITNSKPILPISNLAWRYYEWSPEIETNISRMFDIGIMPLQDREFERGKCGLKLLQYMAAQLPTIASPVGVNKEITIDGVTGYLAGDDAEWYQAIQKLSQNAQLRSEMGKAGRIRCVNHYSVNRWLPELIHIFEQVSMSQ